MDEMKVKIERAALAGLAAGSMLPADRSTDISMDELEALVETAGGVAVGRLLQNRPTPTPAASSAKARYRS